MSMTKADFENVALMFASQYARAEEFSDADARRDAIDKCVHGMARVAILSNRRFNAKRFALASGARESVAEFIAAQIKRDAESMWGLPADYVTH